MHSTARMKATRAFKPAATWRTQWSLSLRPISSWQIILDDTASTKQSNLITLLLGRDRSFKNLWSKSVYNFLSYFAYKRRDPKETWPPLQRLLTFYALLVTQNWYEIVIKPKADFRINRILQVETIGDAYMVASGLPQPNEHHAVEIQAVVSLV